MKKSTVLISIFLMIAGATILTIAKARAQGAPVAGEFQFMFTAEQRLEHANAILRSQAGDHFYGHKQRAMELIDQAFHELQAGVKEFRKRGPAPASEGSSGMTAVRKYRVSPAPGDPGEFTYVHEAMHQLHDAQRVLVKEAEGRFYGHKRRAIELTGEAMDELYRGMEEYKAKGPSHGERHEEQEEHEHGRRMNPTPPSHPMPEQIMKAHPKPTPVGYH